MLQMPNGSKALCTKVHCDYVKQLLINMF